MNRNKNIAWFCAILFVSCLFVNDVNARKVSGSSSSRKSSSSSSGRITKPTYSQNSHADAARLSYSNYNSQPNRPAAPKPAPQPSAPASYPHPAPAAYPHPAPAPAAPPANAKPIGWNVPASNPNVQKTSVQNTNAAPPYPGAGGSPPYPQQATHGSMGAPPPYSQQPSHGAPPPYSASNVNQGYNPGGAPPAYSPYGGNHAAGGSGYQGEQHF